MMNKIITTGSLLIMLFLCTPLHSQKCEILNSHVDRIYSNEEIKILEKRICKLLKKENAIPEDNKIHIYYIPYYCMKDESGEKIWTYKKSDLLDGTFLKNLSRNSTDELRKIRGDTYINANVIVTDSSDNPVAYGDAHQLFITNRYAPGFGQRFAFIIEKKHELKLKYLFKTTFLYPIFGVTQDDSIVVFLSTKEGLYSMKEFIDYYSSPDKYEDSFYE